MPFSNEDVVPKWLLHHLGTPSHDKSFHAVAASDTGAIKQHKKQSSWKFHEPRICEHDCNNGWMSRLEKTAQPILTRLMDGDCTIASLTIDDAKIVRKWAAKTAYMHNSAGLLTQRVPSAHLAALNTDAGEVVPRVIVCLMQSAYIKPSFYMDASVWPHVTNGLFDITQPSLPNAYKIALQFRRLYLLVAYWPDSSAEYVLGPDQFPLFPPYTPAPWLTWNGIDHDESILPVQRFLVNLAIAP